MRTTACESVLLIDRATDFARGYVEEVLFQAGRSSPSEADPDAVRALVAEAEALEARVRPDIEESSEWLLPRAAAPQGSVDWMAGSDLSFVRLHGQVPIHWPEAWRRVAHAHAADAGPLRLERGEDGLLRLSQPELAGPTP